MPLELLTIHQTSHSVCADLRITGSRRCLDAGQAQALLELLPSLAEHACKSRGATRFGERIVGALLPHAAEHVAIDLLVRRHPGTGAISGNTTWLDKETAVMRVRISIVEGIPASSTEQAIQDAVRLLNSVCSS